MSDGHHEVTPSISNQTLNSAFIVALTRSAKTIVDEVMRQEPTEQLGPLARAVWQNLRDQASIVVIKNRLWNPAEECKSMNMTINPGLGDRRGISPNIAGIAVRQIQREEMRLPLLRHAYPPENQGARHEPPRRPRHPVWHSDTHCIFRKPQFPPNKQNHTGATAPRRDTQPANTGLIALLL
jgi:hypothetical protein